MYNKRTASTSIVPVSSNVAQGRLPVKFSREPFQKVHKSFAACDSKIPSLFTLPLFETKLIFEYLQELCKREEILAKKEAMLAEKSELEIKKLRSSQVLNKVSLPCP